MLIHLGFDRVISAEDVIAILDIETMPKKHNYLKEMESIGRIVNISEETAKSCVITEKNVYLSPIAPMTLKRRCEKVIE